MYNQLFKLQSHLIKALAHSRRLEIIYLLRDQALNVSDIHQMLDLPQANISQHLSILRDAKVLKVEKQGKEKIYSIVDHRIIKALDLTKETIVDQNKHSELSDEYSQSLQDLVPLTHDPVCHMRVCPKTASFSLKIDETPYYFCASGCYKSFEMNPHKYIQSGENL